VPLAFRHARRFHRLVQSPSPVAPLPGKILVVDDEEALRDVVSARLAFVADSVRVAADGDEAWRAIEQDPPDVLVTDLSMPERSGEELCRMVRSSAHGQRIWILILTARRGVRRRVEGLDLGADDYLEKPFDLDELAARVRVGLRMRALQRELETTARHAAIGWVAYALGHEIRNPLAVILTNNSALKGSVESFSRLARAARKAVKSLEGAGCPDEAEALREAGAGNPGITAALTDLEEIISANARAGRRAAAAVAALQRFAEGASGKRIRCDVRVLIDDAIQLAFAGVEQLPQLDASAETPAVLAVPRDVVLAIATALSRAKAPADRPFDRTPSIEIIPMGPFVAIRIDGPGDGTPPADLMVARIAERAPNEERVGLDVGLSHALLALRAAGAGLSAGPSERGGLGIEVLLPVAPAEEQAT
jgi:CheY-like chemotaxis protein